MNPLFDLIAQLNNGPSQDTNNPGMMLASQLRPYENDVGAMQDFGYPQQPVQNSFGNPRTISGQIQEWLGAKPSSQGGMDQKILAGRFGEQNNGPQFGQAPSMEDVSQGAVQTLFGGGKPVSGRMVSDERATIAQKMRQAQLMANGGATGALIQQYMDATGADYATALSFVKGAGALAGKGMMAGADGVNPMQGYQDIIQGNAAAGEQGTKGVQAVMNPIIAGREADARNLSDINSIAEKKRQENIGAGNITDAQKKQTGQSNLTTILGSMRRDYNKLNQLGGIISGSRSPEENAAIMARTTGLGQSAGKMFGTGEQIVRENIKSSIPLLMSAIKSATGKSAQEVNSIPEMQLLQQSTTNFKVPIETVLHQFDLLENLYGNPMQTQGGVVHFDDLPQ